jgi:hypothetical protein
MVGSAPVVRCGSGPGTRRVTHQGEPLALALHRLAHKAHEEGLQLLPEPWAPYASRVSSSRLGHFPYVVNLMPGHLHGCDCEGYFRWQRCKHYALALDIAGWLPDVELDGDELLADDHGLWEAAVAADPIALTSRADRRAAAAADLAVRQAQAVAS